MIKKVEQLEYLSIYQDMRKKNFLKVLLLLITITALLSTLISSKKYLNSVAMQQRHIEENMVTITVSSNGDSSSFSIVATPR